MNARPKDPEVTLIYQVTWWTRAGDGTLHLHHDDHTEPASARVQFANCAHASDPVIARLEWDPDRRRWHWTDLAYDARAAGELVAANAKGIRVVRDVIAHARGVDGRGSLLKSLDDTLESDGPVKADPSETLAPEDPAACVVCDYAMARGLASDHPAVPVVVTEQRRLETQF